LNTNRVVGIVDAFRTVKNLAGYAGFFQGWRARVMYQMPSTAIAWSTYELFKYYLMEPSKDASPHSKEDTIDDMRVAQQRHLGRSGAEISNTESDKKDTRLWDQIVTDLPIQVQVVRAESSVNTDLVVRDRTFPGYRT